MPVQMAVRLSLWVVFYLSTTVLLAQATLTVQQATQDAAALRRLLYKMHPAPFAYTPKDTLDALLAALPRTNGPTIEALVFEKRVRALLGRIGCGHTYAQPGRKRIRHAPKKVAVLPLRVFSDGTRLWVRQYMDSTGTAIPSGAEIVQMGDHPLSAALHQIRGHNPSDGYNQTFGIQLLNGGLLTMTLWRKYFPADTLVKVVWRSHPDSALRQTMLRATPISKWRKENVEKKDSTLRILYSTRKKTQYFYRHPQRPEVGVLVIKGFKGDGQKLYRRTFRHLRREHVPNLVIDVRDNLGGSFPACLSLIRHVVDTPFRVGMSRKALRTWRHFDRPLLQGAQRILFFLVSDVFSFTPRWANKGRIYYRLSQKPARRNHFGGRVFILQNGWSFSASSLFSAYAQAKSPRVQVIGQESGGGARTNNGLQIPAFRLRHLDLKVHIPQANMQYNLGPDKGHGVMPDYPTHYTIENVLKGQDLEWLQVWQLLQVSAPR